MSIRTGILRIATAIRVAGIFVGLLVIWVIGGWGNAGNLTLWLIGIAAGAVVMAIAFGIAWIVSGFAPEH